MVLVQDRVQPVGQIEELGVGDSPFLGNGRCCEHGNG